MCTYQLHVRIHDAVEKRFSHVHIGECRALRPARWTPTAIHLVQGIAGAHIGLKCQHLAAANKKTIGNARSSLAKPFSCPCFPWMLIYVFFPSSTEPTSTFAHCSTVFTIQVKSESGPWSWLVMLSS